MKKKGILTLSFALASVLVVGQMAFAAGPNATDNNGMGNMMQGNGMSGMSQMMNNGNMGQMMSALNSPEGKAMINGCSSFMSSYGDNGAKDAK